MTQLMMVLNDREALYEHALIDSVFIPIECDQYTILHRRKMLERLKG